VTTTFFLVRHGAHPLLGHVLAGRMPGVSLNQEGRDQSRRLAAGLARRGVTSLQSSPRERARETAAPIAERCGVPLEIAPALDEVDMGAWTGRAFSDLKLDPGWGRWNALRSIARPPGGERLIEVQSRVTDHLDRVRHERPDSSVVIVSHGDVIKAAILYYLGLSLDACERIEVDVASLSALLIGDWGAKLISLNEPVSA